VQVAVQPYHPPPQQLECRVGRGRNGRRRETRIPQHVTHEQVLAARQRRAAQDHVRVGAPGGREQRIQHVELGLGTRARARWSGMRCTVAVPPSTRTARSLRAARMAGQAWTSGHGPKSSWPSLPPSRKTNRFRSPRSSSRPWRPGGRGRGSAIRGPAGHRSWHALRERCADPGAAQLPLVTGQGLVRERCAPGRRLPL
jgi:hypothetical protein